MSKELLFKVKMTTGGDEYKIYTNGEIEGFGKGAIVFNYYPQLAREFEARRRALQQESPHSLMEVNT